MVRSYVPTCSRVVGKQKIETRCDSCRVQASVLAILPRLRIEWRGAGDLRTDTAGRHRRAKHPKNVPVNQEASCPTRKRSFLLRSLPHPTKLTVRMKARSIAWLAMNF